MRAKGDEAALKKQHEVDKYLEAKKKQDKRTKEMEKKFKETVDNLLKERQKQEDQQTHFAIDMLEH